MGFFCVMWIPVFFFFRCSFTTSGSGRYVWALLLGSLAVVIQSFFGLLVIPSGFGYSRWVHGFVDIISIPVLAPIIMYWLLVAFRVFSTNVSQVNFILLWLVPFAVYRSVTQGANGSPLVLVLVPLLWTVQGVGIPFFINSIVQRSRSITIVFSVLCIIALPVFATTCWWAFFSHQTLIGFLLLFGSLVPALISIIFDFQGEKTSAKYSHEGTEAQN